MPSNSEQARLQRQAGIIVQPWEHWGAYVAERSWGTVREDYSADGEAWNFFTHDLAASKVYRWGEDAIAGWCDRYQVLICAPAFWNGQDPLLKERLFGLAATEGNHGEDVKEYYYHLDATPTHSYLKFLYKYPQGPFPYTQLREENRQRGPHDQEYELIDTGIFQDNRYFDIFIEYAKAAPDDTCIRITAINRGDQAAPLHIIPQLWFRNQWAWQAVLQPQPTISAQHTDTLCLVADDTQLLSPPTLAFDYHLGKYYLYGPSGGIALFTDNEQPSTSRSGYLKDAFHRAIVQHQNDATNPADTGTKACLHYVFPDIPAHESVTLLLRLTNTPLPHPLDDVAAVITQRKNEADAFYASIHPTHTNAEERQIQRQALAGLLWSKQIYLFDVNLWLKGDNSLAPPPATRWHIRNNHWRHLNSMRILTMPDKWEYPYFCAWDQAFHCLTLGLVDIVSAKEQLWLLLFDQFQHPNGQIPACEWEFSDLNPPVQSWAALRLYALEKARHGVADSDFLKKCFHKLLLNFTWWVNRVDNAGNNIFEGGFLGLDNITVFDRSQQIADGVRLQQSDGTGWMAMFCLNMMRMALELAKTDSTYQEMATKFFQHYVYIAHAMKRMGEQCYSMWNEEDGFFYDVLVYPDGNFTQFRVRSLVGIIPLFAVEFLSTAEIGQFPEFARNLEWFLAKRPDLVANCVYPVASEQTQGYLLALVNQEQLRRVLHYVWDPNEFRAPYGLRSLSKYHLEHPFTFHGRSVGYEPATATEKIKGGNSNWRGPIWAPTTFLLIDALRRFSVGWQREVEITLADEPPVTLSHMAQAFAERFIGLFRRDQTGMPPAMSTILSQNTSVFADYLLFYEYFNAETGQGLGASHQTGWTALVANLIAEFR